MHNMQWERKVKRKRKKQRYCEAQIWKQKYSPSQKKVIHTALHVRAHFCVQCENENNEMMNGKNEWIVRRRKVHALYLMLCIIAAMLQRSLWTEIWHTDNLLRWHNGAWAAEPNNWNMNSGKKQKAKKNANRWMERVWVEKRVEMISWIRCIAVGLGDSLTQNWAT